MSLMASFGSGNRVRQWFEFVTQVMIYVTGFTYLRAAGGPLHFDSLGKQQKL